MRQVQALHCKSACMKKVRKYAAIFFRWKIHMLLWLMSLILYIWKDSGASINCNMERQFLRSGLMSLQQLTWIQVEQQLVRNIFLEQGWFTVVISASLPKKSKKQQLRFSVSLCMAVCRTRRQSLSRSGFTGCHSCYQHYISCINFSDMPITVF